jgi:hypothetical protein
MEEMWGIYVKYPLLLFEFNRKLDCIDNFHEISFINSRLVTCKEICMKR